MSPEHYPGADENVFDQNRLWLKVIVTGDSSQKDLPVGTRSGLDVASRVLSRIDDIAFCHLTSKDVVRHPLVQKIVKAYDEYEAKEKNRSRVKNGRK